MKYSVIHTRTASFVFINSLRSTANAVVAYTIRDIRYVAEANRTVKLGTVELVKDAAGNIFWRELVSTTLSWLDNFYTSQKNLINQFKNLIFSETSLRKENFGEMASDVLLSEKGYQPKHVRIVDIDASTKQGIDHVFEKSGQYYIFESKYKGSATLGSTADGKQMSKGWIEGSNRLIDAVGSEVEEDIIDKGYQRLLAEVAPDGSVIFKLLDENANVIGTFVP